MESNHLELNVKATVEADLKINGGQAKSELDNLFETIQQKLKETTTREIGEYATAAKETLSKSWGDATDVVTGAGGEAITDTLSAIFSGEMDKVQDIWEKAWTDMGDGLEKTWEGLLSTLGDKAMEGLGDILQESIIDPISDFLGTTVWEPFKEWGSSLLGDALDWVGLGGIGEIFGIGSSSKTGGSTVGQLAEAGKSAYDAYNFATGAPAMLSSGAAAVEALGAASELGVGAVGDALGAAIESIFTGADMATEIYAAIGPAQEAAWISKAMGEIWGTAEAASGGAAAVETAAAGAAAGSEAAGAAAAGASMGTVGGVAVGGLAVLLAAAEGVSALFGEVGPVTGLLDDWFSDYDTIKPEESRQRVADGVSSLSKQAAGAADGDWSSTTVTGLNAESAIPGMSIGKGSELFALQSLAFDATKRHGAGIAIGEIGGISTADIEAQVAAMGPYAQALYDVQTITWQVSDALAAYNEQAERGWFMAKDQAEEFRNLAMELGVTEIQYQAMIDKGYSFEQISAMVTETAGDLRIAMIDMAGAMERAAAETGLAEEQADAFGAQAATLWEQVQAGIMGVGEFDQKLEELGQSLGLDASASEELAGRLENMLAATRQAGRGAQGLSEDLAMLASESSAASVQTASATEKFIDFGNVVGGAAAEAEGLGNILAQTGADAVEFGEASAEVMSSAFVSWKEGFGEMADSASELAGEVLDVGKALDNVFGPGNAGDAASLGKFVYTYHDGGMAGLAGWPRFHSGLLPEELPAVLQRGEAIIQRSAVNSETLPLLKRINDTGRVPASGGGLNVHVEVHGNVLGDGDGMEELARIIDRRLRRIDSARYSM